MFSIGNMKVGARLGLGFGLVLLLLIVIAGVGALRMKQINAAATDLGEDKVPKMLQTMEIDTALEVIAKTCYALIAAPDENFASKQRSEMAEARKEITDNVEKLKNTIHSPKGKELLQDIVAALSTYNAALDEMNKLFAEGKKEEAFRFTISKVRDSRIAFDTEVNKLVKYQDELMDEADAEADAAYSSGLTLLAVLVTLATLLSILIAWLLTRSVTRPLNEAVRIATTVAAGDLTADIDVTSQDETGQLLQALKNMNESLKKIVGEVRAGTDSISTGAQQIASGNADLSQRTEEQASSLEETASAMEELTSTVKQNAENALQANKLAEQASVVAVNGGNVVSHVVSTMSEINESSKKIVDIISVIDGIAFQTNILALNAAVEAARAGEQGRGFAVVATEVRNLAQRSAAAAKEIKVLIDNSVGKVEEGSKLVDQAGKTMEEVVSSVKRVTDIMAEITTASQEQSTGIGQVSQAVAQMDEVTQQNAALVEEAAAASQSMQEEAQNLARLMEAFKLADNAVGVVATSERRNTATRAENVKRMPLKKPAAKKQASSTAVTTRVAPSIKRVANSAPSGASGTEDWEEF